MLRSVDCKDMGHDVSRMLGPALREACVTTPMHAGWSRARLFGMVRQASRFYPARALRPSNEPLYESSEIDESDESIAMRVGKPVKALPQPLCDYCGAKAVLARAGDESYPFRDDHGPVWICTPCQAWIGIHARSTRHVPLGRLADAALRDAKSRLHDALEPLVAGKVRRDGVNAFEARAKAIRWVATELGFDPLPNSLHTLTLDQCEQALRFVDAFMAARRSS